MTAIARPTPTPFTPADKRAEAKRKLEAARKRVLSSDANKRIVTALAKR